MTKRHQMIIGLALLLTRAVIAFAVSVRLADRATETQTQEFR